MGVLRLALTVIFLTCVVPCHSDWSFLDLFRKLEQGYDASKINAQVWAAPRVFFFVVALSDHEKCLILGVSIA